MYCIVYDPPSALSRELGTAVRAGAPRLNAVIIRTSRMAYSETIPGTGKRILENYTFLTPEMALARPNVYACRERQVLGGISNLH